MVRSLRTLSAVAAVALLADNAGAAVVAQYAFTGMSAGGSTSAPVTSVISGVTATPIVPNNTSGGPYAVPSSPSSVVVNNVLGASAPYYQFFPNTATVTGGGTAASTVASDSYQSLTLSTGTGTLDLINLTYIATKGGSGTRGLVVRSSIDGFASNLTVVNSTNPAVNTDITTINGVGATADNVSITLPAAFQSATSVTFRFYAYTDNTGRSINIDDITFNNSTLVPEPTMLGLAGLGGLSLLARRRRA